MEKLIFSFVMFYENQQLRPLQDPFSQYFFNGYLLQLVLEYIKLDCDGSNLTDHV
jgi:hypothetical protein